MTNYNPWAQLLCIFIFHTSVFLGTTSTLLCCFMNLRCLSHYKVLRGYLKTLQTLQQKVVNCSCLMQKMITSQTSHPSSLSFVRAPSGYSYFCLIRCVFREEVMKTPLWTLLLLCFCSSGHSDCQGDCLTCGLILPEHQAFNTLVSAPSTNRKVQTPY